MNENQIKILQAFEGTVYYDWSWEDEQTLKAIPYSDYFNIPEQTIYFSTDGILEFTNVQINKSRLPLLLEYSEFITVKEDE